MSSEDFTFYMRNTAAVFLVLFNRRSSYQLSLGVCDV